MRRFLQLTVAFLCAAFLSGGCEDDTTAPTGGAGIPTVIVETTMGDITVEVFPRAAPITVANFVQYAQDAFYDSLLIHRVIPSFVILGGGLDKDMQRRATRDPIPIESNNGLKNTRGTIAMARTVDPQSATSQFFINLKDNPALDFIEESPGGWGYCVFGRVTQGMDVVDAISGVPTTTREGYNDVPVDPIFILRVQVENWPIFLPSFRP